MDLLLFRFNRLAWGHVDGNRPQGVIAAGLENGELALWDPAKILAGAGYVVAYF
jgi:protein transport protein SEC31